MKIKNLTGKLQEHRYTILFGAILLVYFFNLFIDVMEVDAAQYAEISMEMSFTRNFLHVFQQGQDYLDKPPLLFWLSSVSFIIFGISNFAYKLPSVLIALLGIYSTWRFARIYYSREKATLAALIVASSQALFLITNDVRTDTTLLGLVMFSVWQLSEYLIQPRWKNLILASIAIGCAMMAKGPIALIIPAAAFGSDLILKRQWKNIFRPEWLVLLIIIAITLIPMSWGLYTQYDLHPEKTVYGLNGPSGLRFFYWTQSFGRITGENYWQNDAGYFFFFHSILWDFQPWVLLFIPALILKIRKIILRKFKSGNDEEYITLGGFVLIFFALSLSKYKLPHYIFVLFPFASILAADFIYELKGKLQSRISKIQFGIMQLFWLLILIDFIFFFPPKNPVLPTVLALLFATNLYLFRTLKGSVERIFLPTLVTAIGFNMLMGLNFYPNLLSYQSTSQAGRMMEANKIPEEKVYCYKQSDCSFDFYAKRLTPTVDSVTIRNLKTGTWVYLNGLDLEEIKRSQISYREVQVFPSFKVTALELPFLYAKTRSQCLKNDYLIEIQ
ncbi:MAG: glycosyltransferase family 39 protein [Prolixibacteraceae bacterium]